MNGDGKSDRPVVPANPPNNAARAAAEAGDRRSNTDQVRYLLARLTAYVEEQTNKPNIIREYLEGTERIPRWQIEHLWPSTHGPDGNGARPARPTIRRPDRAMLTS